MATIEDDRHVFDNRNLLRKMPNLEAAISEFSLVGQLLEFFSNERQEIEAISIAVDDRPCRIKLSKKLQETIGSNLQLGSWLEIQGIKKQPVTGATIFRAKSLKKKTIDDFFPKSNLSLSEIFPDLTGEKTPAKTSILICSRSKCWKRGGKDICQLLKQNIRSRGWQEKVTIETTGCMKKCKYAPNLMMMPDETRYSEVSPHQIPKLLDKHL